MGENLTDVLNVAVALFYNGEIHIITSCTQAYISYISSRDNCNLVSRLFPLVEELTLVGAGHVTPQILRGKLKLISGRGSRGVCCVWKIPILFVILFG